MKRLILTLILGGAMATMAQQPESRPKAPVTLDDYKLENAGLKLDIAQLKEQMLQLQFQLVQIEKQQAQAALKEQMMAQPKAEAKSETSKK